MTTPLEILLSLVPPLVLLGYGWSIKTLLFKSEHDFSIIEDILIILTIGVSLFMLVFMSAGILLLDLILSIRIFTILGIVLTLVTLAKQGVSRLFSDSLSWIRSIFRNSNNLQLLAAFAYLSYIFKVGFTCLLGPIISGDALYFWLSMAKVFLNTNSIPVSDPYHMWSYSGEPVSSGLYSWGYLIFGSTDLELFRGIPILFFAVIPLIAYSLVKYFGGSKDAANIALFVMIFMPIMDYMLFFYTYYTDTFALVFAFISIIFLKKALRTGKHSAAFIAGLALSLSILSKYAFGLLAAVFIILEIVSIHDGTKPRKLLSIILSTGVLVVMIILANYMWNCLNLLSGIMIFSFALGILYLRFRKDEDLMNHIGLNLKLIFSTAAGALFSMIWGLRSLLIGGSLFGIGFLRLTPISPESSEVTSVLTEIFPPSSILLRYNPITPIGVIFHPLVNGIFFALSILIIISLLRYNEGNIVTSEMLFWYLGYLTVMGYFISGRHVFSTVFLFASLLGIGIMSYTDKMEDPVIARVSKFLLLSLFSLTAFLQMFTFASVFIDTGIGLFFIPYSSQFSLNETPAIVAQIFGLSILSLAVFTFGSSKTISLKLHRIVKNRRIIVAGILIISISLSTPLVYSALNKSQGNLFEYSSLGSWNRNDFLMGEELKDMIQENEIILTYGDVVLSYMEFKIVDLYHQGLYYLPEIVQETNTTKIREILISKNIYYLILPTQSSYLDESYSRFLSFLSFTEDLTFLEQVELVRVFPGWRLYTLT